VRIGNIALMPSVKVQVRQHLMDTYLVESRSIGGLSGSLIWELLESLVIKSSMHKVSIYHLCMA
jgi:hypothetical protein